MNSDLGCKFNNFKLRSTFQESEDDYVKTQFHNDEVDFQQSVEEGEISSDSEEKKNILYHTMSSKCILEESFQWSELQILMIGDERVNDYNWKYQQMYPNQHFFHYKSAKLHTLCEFIDNQINKFFDIVLIFAFHYDFIQQQHDKPLFVLNPKVNTENLTKTVIEFHTKWKKLYCGTNIIWVLPSAMNFYEYNLMKVQNSKLFANSVNETEQHSLSKGYFDYTQKLSQCWRRNLKTIPYLPLNDVLFMKKHAYRKSFYEDQIPKFPRGLLIDGLKPTMLMTGYLAYKLTEFLHEEGFFPLIKGIPNLRKTVDNVLKVDSSLKKYVHSHSKKRERSSHRHRHNKRRKHYSNSSFSESTFSSDLDSRNINSSRSRPRHRSRKHRKVSSRRSRSSSQSISKLGIDKILSHGFKLVDTPPHPNSISSPSEEVEFYRKLACLREVHDIQCNVYRCKPTTHPFYDEENKKFVNQMHMSNFSASDIADKWDSFWKNRLEELCNENWEIKKGQMILDLKMKKSLIESKETCSGLQQLLPNVQGVSKEQIVNNNNDMLKDNKSKILHSDINSSPSSALIDLTESPIKKEKLKIKIEDYKKMQRHKSFASELQEEIKKFLTSSGNISQESVGKKIEYPRCPSSPPNKIEVSTISLASTKLIPNLEVPLNSPKCHSISSSAPDFKDEIKKVLASSVNICQESMDKNVEYPMCPSSPANNTEILTKSSTSPKFISNLGINLASLKCHSSTSSAPDFKEEIRNFLASNICQESMGKKMEYPKCPSPAVTNTEVLTKTSTPKLMSNLGNPLVNPNCQTFTSSVSDFKEEIKNFLASAKNNFHESGGENIEYTKCPSSPANNTEVLTKISALPKLVDLGTTLMSPKCHSSTSSAIDFREEIKKFLASSENTIQSPMDVKSGPSKCLAPPESSNEVLTNNSAPPILISNSETNLLDPKINPDQSSDSESILIDSDCDIDVDMLMDDDDFLLDLKEIDEELKKAVPLSVNSSPESTSKEISFPLAVIPPKVNSASLGKHLLTAPIPLKVNAPSTVLLPKAIVPPNFGPTKLLPQATVMPSISYALKEKLLPKATISPLRCELEPIVKSINVLESPVKDQTYSSRSEVAADYVIILKMLFRLARHLGSLGLSITSLYNAAMEELQTDEDAVCFPDDDAKTILTLVNQKLNSLLKGNISQVQRAIFGEVSGRLRKLLVNLTMQHDKFSNVNIQNIALATIGQSVNEIVTFIKNTLLYHGYHNFQSKDVMNLYMSVKAAHSNMCNSS